MKISQSGPSPGPYQPCLCLHNAFLNSTLKIINFLLDLPNGSFLKRCHKNYNWFLAYLVQATGLTCRKFPDHSNNTQLFHMFTTYFSVSLSNLLSIVKIPSFIRFLDQNLCAISSLPSGKHILQIVAMQNMRFYNILFSIFLFAHTLHISFRLTDSICSSTILRGLSVLIPIIRPCWLFADIESVVQQVSIFEY